MSTDESRAPWMQSTTEIVNRQTAQRLRRESRRQQREERNGRVCWILFCALVLCIAVPLVAMQVLQAR